MTDKVPIRVVSAAAELELPGPVCAEVFFPYVHVEATCNAPAFANPRRLPVNCLVDAVNDLAATADAFECVQIDVEPQAIVDARVGIAAARRTAQRYLFHHLGRRARAILDFGIETGSATVVYKRFFVVRSGIGQVLVDSTTGGSYALPQAT